MSGEDNRNGERGGREKRDLSKARSASRRDRAARGVTLIEALACLAILALIVTVSAPQLATGLGAIEFTAKSDAYIEEIERLRIRSFVDGRKITFPEDDDRADYGAPAPIDDEGMEGWTIAGGPLVFLETGVCLGGRITLAAPSGRSRSWEFDAPECAARRL